jgi:predicted DNA-binding transcriptional regulator YafY
MPKTEKKDLRLLQIMQFLSRESSDDHPLSMADILHYLQNKGICCARKAVGRDIASLRAFGYPILFTRTPTAGYYLASRDLKTPEVRILIDAVNAAPFLTEEMTCNLTEKLQNMVDRRDCAALQKQIYYDPVYKQSNAEIGSTINTLYQAIALGKKVNFRYYHCAIRDSRIQPDEGRLFSISPYALFWHGDYYYLAGNYQKYSNVANYRLDRMYGVQKLPEDARPFSEVTRYNEAL